MGPDYPRIAQRTALRSRSSLRSVADGAPSHMMIVNPLSAGGIKSLFSTHPPMAKRIERLNGMPVEAR